MDLFSEIDIAPWLDVFAENIAMGLILVLVYDLLRPSLKLDSGIRNALAIGLLFGIGAIGSMNDAIKLDHGQSVDARIIFVLTGSLFGGPIGAALTAAITVAYRLSIGGGSAWLGVATIVASGLIGLGFNRIYRDRIKDFGVLRLAGIGLLNTLVVTAIVEIGAAHWHVGGLPPSAELTGLAMFPLGSALLGVTLSMTHHRVWGRTQQRLADIVESTTDLVWETDADGRFTFLSGRLRDIAGIDPSELLGKTIEATGTRWIDAETESAAAAARKARKPYVNLLGQLRGRDGTYRTVLLNARPIFDEDGRFTGYRGAAQDVTERERTQLELRRKEQHLARVQTIGGIGSTEVDLASQEATWSDEIYRILGVEPGAIRPSVDTFAAAIHPDDRAMMRELSLRGRRGEDVEPSEFRVVRNGEVRWLLRHADFVRDAAGKPVSLIATMYDITERKRMEDELRRSHDGLVRAQKMGQIGSGEVNLVTGETVWSAEMYAMMGLDPAGGASLERYLPHVHPDDREALRAAREANERGDAAGPLEYRFIRPDGEQRWFHREVDVKRDSQGRVIALYTTQQDITERRRLEEELRRSAAHLRHAQQAAKIGSAEVDLATRAEIWSEGMRAMFGIEAGTRDAAYSDFLARAHPDDRAALKRLRDLNERGIATDPFVYRITRPDGELRWIRRAVDIVHDAAGKPSRLLAIHQDVTDSKLAEDELRRSRDANARNLRTLRMLTDCNQLLIQASGEAQLLRDICRTICEIGGYALAWVGRVESDPGKSVVPVVSYSKGEGGQAADYVRGLRISWDENSERGRGPMGRSIRTQRVVVERDTEAASDYAPWRDAALACGYRSTLTIPLVDDAQVFAAIGIYSTAADAFDPAEIELMGELGSDIAYGIQGLRTRAARDKAERELSIARDELRAITDNTVDGLITIDERGSILTFNRPAEAIFGYPASELVGRNVSILMPSPADAQHDGHIRRYFKTGVPKIIGVGREVRGRRRDGSQFPMDLQVEELPKGAGGRRFVGTVRDITGRKQTEAQLLQAQKMEAMGQLTGGVAHDFNNLLGVILGRLEILEQDLADVPRHRASAQSCIRAVERGATLTRSLLAFARQQSLMPVELDLNAVLGDMEELLQSTLGEAYEFKVIGGTGLWATEADPGQLQNALLNLVLNARDAMPDGGKVTVTMSNERLDAEYAANHRDVRSGDYIALSVSDTGTGMSPEVIARAFEPFYTTKESGKGSGLGLSMVYGFVKQTGGHVAIYSEPGHGTVVRVYLPRKFDIAAVAAVPAAKKAPAVGGDETILVVEDNDDLRGLTRIQLERLGYKVFDAMHATEGLEILSAHPEIALLLTDVVLPHGIDGPQLAERARAIQPKLEVVFMSGYHELHGAFEKAGGGRPVRLLQKPFHHEALAQQIRAALDGRDAATNPTSAVVPT